MPHPSISVTSTPDGMKAFLYVSDALADYFPGENELMGELRSHGVTFGVDPNVIKTMVAKKALNTYIEVAQGVAPVAGVPGRIEILIDVSVKGKPRKLADGRVDHRDISYVVNVTKGTPLLKHIPPVPGQRGRTVFDQPIEPPPVADEPLCAGKGTIIANDASVLCADINGDVIVHKGGKIDVVDRKTITGNIDYSTGNIRFPGDLRISGTVLAGFEVETEGSCSVGGNVEDAQISCRHDMEICGGAIGVSKGCLKCGGSLKVRHMANFSVQAGGDITIHEDALHCVLTSDGTITAKAIVGGTVAAWKVIDAETIGTDAEPKTIIDLGGRFILMQKKYSLLKELARLMGEIGTMKENLFQLVRGEMDAGGMLHEGSISRLATMKELHRQRKEKYSQVQTDIETVDGKLKDTPVPFLKAHTIFPNTIIKFGTFEKLIREKLSKVRITVDAEKIIIGKYET
jgi:uncharacterized protein